MTIPRCVRIAGSAVAVVGVAAALAIEGIGYAQIHVRCESPVLVASVSQSTAEGLPVASGDHC